MASSVRRPGKNPSSPKFFKIILDPQAHKLKLPRDFTTRYGLVLPHHMHLKAPNGPSFQVELINSDGQTWLQKGWREFVEYYSIEFGHFVLFKYDRVSHFRVCIFDRTASEIKAYPFGDNCDKVLGSGSESDGSVEGVKIGKRRILYDDNDKTSVGNVSDEDWEKRRKLGEQCVDKKTSAAYQRAEDFKSDNPIKGPSFISLMQPSYISRSVLTVPASIIKENLAHKKNDIKLRTCDGAMWEAKCTILACAALSSLKSFMEDNKLKVGDACVFELSMLDKCLWNVYIFRC